MSKLRLGSIEFINSLPVDYGLQSGAVSVNAKIIEGSPLALNQMIMKNELDVSPVSVFFYAQNAERLYLFPQLSISSLSGVESVLLFTQKKLEELQNSPIILTQKGQTTPVLLEILCRKRYGFKPMFIAEEKMGSWIQDPNVSALVIGDEALLLKEKLKGSKWKAVDLAEEWRNWTGLPIVFAVWAARKDFFDQNEELVQQVHASILESKRYGLEHPDEIIARAQEKINLPKDKIQFYLSLLSYDLTPELIRGMKLYFQYASECGLLPSKLEISFLPDSSVIQK